MPEFHTTHAIAHSAPRMFDLVADVEKYPEFVPLCHRLRVRDRTVLIDGRTVLITDMTAAYAMFRETFATKVTLDRAGLKIAVEYLSGPFRHLENVWKFKALGAEADVPAAAPARLKSGAPAACRSEIDFFIDYEFKSRTLGGLMATVFDRTFRKFVAAFETRADEIYGRSAAPPSD